jgi:hypothetical protein
VTDWYLANLKERLIQMDWLKLMGKHLDWMKWRGMLKVTLMHLD